MTEHHARIQDPGALITAERDDPRFRALHTRFVQQERHILVLWRAAENGKPPRIFAI